MLEETEKVLASACRSNIRQLKRADLGCVWNASRLVFRQVTVRANRQLKDPDLPTSLERTGGPDVLPTEFRNSQVRPDDGRHTFPESGNPLTETFPQKGG